MVGGEWRNFRPHGTCSIAAGDLRAQSLPGAQNLLLYDRQAAPLEMTMRREAYCLTVIDTIRHTKKAVKK